MSPSANRRLRTLALLATPVIFVVTTLYAAAAGASTGTILSQIVVSGAFVVAGFIAWASRPANRREHDRVGQVRQRLGHREDVLIRDQVPAAIDGTLEVTSPIGGTRLLARIPTPASPATA